MAKILWKGTYTTLGRFGDDDPLHLAFIRCEEVSPGTEVRVVLGDDGRLHVEANGGDCMGDPSWQRLALIPTIGDDGVSYDETGSGCVRAEWAGVILSAFLDLIGGTR